MQKIVEEKARELLNLIGVNGDVSIEEDSENDAYVVQIDTEEAGILIGKHGETISAFQLLLNQMLNKGSEDKKRIIVNCGDYRERQEEMLRNLAENAASRAKETGETQAIYDLTPAQRRIVHMVLSEDTTVLTHSEGEGRDRHLVVEPRT